MRTGSQPERYAYNSTNTDLPALRTGDDLVITDASEVSPSLPHPEPESGIVAELHIDHERLTLRPTLRAVANAEIVPEYRAAVEGSRSLLFVAVSAECYDELERALEEDPTVASPVLVDRFVDQRVYRVEVTEQSISVAGELASAGGRITDATGTSTGWILQTRLPSRESLVTFNGDCKRRDVSVRVRHLRIAREDSSCHLGLTAKQQELLTIAHEEGYFDVPRRISQDELADRLGVSKSAVSQRLRRAMSELCNTTFDR